MKQNENEIAFFRHKPGVRNQRGRFSASAEYVVYGSHGPVTEGQASPVNVLSHPIDKDRQHIAQKPLAVMKWICGVVPEGAIVLDPFAGSGSTLIAAAQMGHRVIGIESDRNMCDLIKRCFEGKPEGGLF